MAGLRVMLICLGAIVASCSKPQPTTGGTSQSAGPTDGVAQHRLCEQGSAAACVALANDYWDGAGVPKDPNQAVAFAQRACELSDVAGCGMAALMLAANGVEENRAAARRYAERTCELSASVERTADVADLLGKACASSGGMYFHGELAPRDLLKSATYWTRGCEFGDAGACFGVGLMYDRGQGVEKDGLRAATAFQKACDKEHAFACGQLADMYITGRGLSKDVARARTFAKKACDFGNPSGCTTYGFTLAAGAGGAKDPEAAVRVLRQPCEKEGITRACSIIGQLYAVGDGTIRKDLDRADKLLTVACDASEEMACFWLGNVLCDLSSATQRDCPRAVRAFEKSCQAKSVASACALVGLMLYEGRPNVPADPARAARLLETGCDSGEAVACHVLGQMSLRGHGVPQDVVKGLGLVQRACRAGLAEACETQRQLMSE